MACETRREVGAFEVELLRPGRGDAVLAHLTAGVGHGRRGLDPAFEEQLLEGGIERPFLDAQLIARELRRCAARWRSRAGADSRARAGSAARGFRAAGRRF